MGKLTILGLSVLDRVALTGKLLIEAHWLVVREGKKQVELKQIQGIVAITWLE